MLPFLHLIVGSLVGAQSDGCGVRWAHAGKTFDTLVEVPDDQITMNRSIRIYTPKTYDQFQPIPLIIDYHGYSQTVRALSYKTYGGVDYGASPVARILATWQIARLAEGQSEESGWKAIADTYNFAVVWPGGLDDTIGKLFGTDTQATSWNGVGTTTSPGPKGPTCKWMQDDDNGYPCHATCHESRGCRNLLKANGCDCTSCANDGLFTEKLLDAVEAELCINLDRIHLTGFSNGGMMVYSLATEHPVVAKRIASVVTYGSSPLLGFVGRPLLPMALMDIHGAADDIIPANRSQGEPGGPEGATVSSDGFYYAETDEVMKVWADANACSGEPQHYFTKFDGDTELWCVHPHGANCVHAVVRCSHSLGHTYPFGKSNAQRRASHTPPTPATAAARGVQYRGELP